MSDYQLTAAEEPCVVIREVDRACIPPDPGNSDYAKYLQWKDDGGVPDPHIEPPPPEDEGPSPEQQVLYDHENRVRALEGHPPLTLEEMIDKMKAER